jgi:uncharacterized membrane protein YfcA
MVVEIVLVLTAVGVGAVVQGSIGFGFSLVAVPVLTLIRPESVPVTLMLVAPPMTIIMAMKEWRSIDVAAFTWISGGRVPGTLVGLALLVVVPADPLARLLGFLVVVAVLMSCLGTNFEARSSIQFAGGVASGIMSTVAALGGPPLALVNQKRRGPELRSTLAISFLVGLLMSLVALALAGRVEAQHFVWALGLLPGLLLGLWASRQVAGLLDERWLRPTILAFAALAGLAIVVFGPQG